MLLSSPDSTPFDLTFRVFGVHVRVHPMFWLVTGILGWSVTQNPVLPGNGLGDLALWILCAFLSILLHELGHVWMGRLFGADGHILLHGMGGLAIGSGDVRYRWQRILVSFAGPAIQLVLWGGLKALILAGFLPNPADFIQTPLTRTLLILLLINLYWPLLNLLPIWPLDGGMICREVCQIVSRRNGLIVSLWISVVVAAVLAIHSVLAMQGNGFIPWIGGSLYMALFFALFAVSSYQAIQAERSYRPDVYHDDRLPWER